MNTGWAELGFDLEGRQRILTVREDAGSWSYATQRDCCPSLHKQIMGNLFVDPGFCLQPHWGGSTGQPGGAAPNKPPCFNIVPVMWLQV